MVVHAGQLVKKIFFNTLIEIFFEALEKNGKYKCWLKPDTYLPMIYIDDCIAATVISSSNSKTGSTFES